MKVGLREAMFLVVLLAMPLSALWFVFRPQNEEIGAARKEIEQKEMMLEKLDEATAQTRDLERANEEMAEAIALIESRLPSDKEVEVVLEQVADLARKSRLELPRVKAGAEVRSARYMEKPLEMTIEGDFDDFYSFLLRLEQLDRIWRMPDLTVTKSKRIDGAMQASFTLSVYFQPESVGGGG